MLRCRPGSLRHLRRRLLWQRRLLRVSAA